MFFNLNRPEQTMFLFITHSVFLWRSLSYIHAITATKYRFNVFLQYISITVSLLLYNLQL